MPPETKAKLVHWMLQFVAALGVTLITSYYTYKAARFETEIGFQYFSAPTVAYSFSGTGCTSYVGGVYSGCGPIPQTNITSEQNKLQNDLYDLRFFPILSFGLSYKIH